METGQESYALPKPIEPLGEPQAGGEARELVVEAGGAGVGGVNSGGEAGNGFDGHVNVLQAAEAQSEQEESTGLPVSRDGGMESAAAGEGASAPSPELSTRYQASTVGLKEFRASRSST